MRKKKSNSSTAEVLIIPIDTISDPVRQQMSSFIENNVVNINLVCSQFKISFPNPEEWQLLPLIKWYGNLGWQIIAFQQINNTTKSWLRKAIANAVIDLINLFTEIPTQLEQKKEELEEWAARSPEKRIIFTPNKPWKRSQACPINATQDEQEKWKDECHREAEEWAAMDDLKSNMQPLFNEVYFPYEDFCAYFKDLLLELSNKLKFSHDLVAAKKKEIRGGIKGGQTKKKDSLKVAEQIQKLDKQLILDNPLISIADRNYAINKQLFSNRNKPYSDRQLARLRKTQLSRS